MFGLETSLMKLCSIFRPYSLSTRSFSRSAFDSSFSAIACALFSIEEKHSSTMFVFSSERYFIDRPECSSLAMWTQ